MSKIKLQIIYSYFQRALQVLLVPIRIAIITKSISQEDYGKLNIILTTGMIFTFVFSLGLQKYQGAKIPGLDKIKQLEIFKT